MMQRIKVLSDLLPATALGLFLLGELAAQDFEGSVIPFLDSYCMECHDDVTRKGDLDLYRFATEADVMADRNIWAAVFEKVESHQMPPPKSGDQPSEGERQQLLDWIEQIAARPDLELEALDPGKPLIRRLTRLEYNNTIRDLFELDMDVFIFPERLNFSDRSYYQPQKSDLGRSLKVSMREYGGRYRVLVPQAGLPADSRAEHGFRNRGEAMDFSPLLLEKYVQVAGKIVHTGDLPQRSPKFARLLGMDPQTLPPLPQSNAGSDSFPVSDSFAPDLGKIQKVQESPLYLEGFRNSIRDAYVEGRGGVADFPATLGNTTVAGKGGLLKADFGGRQLTINPNEDLWVVNFSTAKEASAPLLVANKEKLNKVYELTFDVRGTDSEEGIEQLGFCVLGRRGQNGNVLLTAVLSNGTETSIDAEMTEGDAGTRFASFVATPGETIRKLRVDGSQFTGDYVLLDEIGFITNGAPQSPQILAEWRKSLTQPKAEKEKGSMERPLSQRKKKPARARLAEFMEEAFRRPVESAEIDRFYEIYQETHQAGLDEAESMKLAVQAVLSSPNFLFLEMNGPQEPQGAVTRLDDFELACRISYFLWSTLPDRELLEAAKSGKLSRDPAELERQVRRMLRDPKSKELSESFAYQWLRLDQLYSSKPDRDLFGRFYSGPQGKATLHAAALIEPLLLFETVLAEDRPIMDLIAPDYSWLNVQMVSLYDLESSARPQIQEIKGPEPVRPEGDEDEADIKKEKQEDTSIWYRLQLPDMSRGGILTMSGPLTVTSFPFRTSPVKRGAWLLETVFNRPPTEPKVAFMIENDTKEAAQSMSVREKFEAHRTDAACYSCHVRLDPPGFALESFDPIGAWREEDAGMRVDAGGEWGGASFNGPAEFKQILADNPQEFTRGFVEHLLSYALSRKLEIYDMPAIAAIQRAAGEDDWKFSRVVVEIVKSYPFTHTQASPVSTNNLVEAKQP